MAAPQQGPPAAAPQRRVQRYFTDVQNRDALADWRPTFDVAPLTGPVAAPDYETPAHNLPYGMAFIYTTQEPDYSGSTNWSHITRLIAVHAELDRGQGNMFYDQVSVGSISKELLDTLHLGRVIRAPAHTYLYVVVLRIGPRNIPRAEVSRFTRVMSMGGVYGHQRFLPGARTMHPRELNYWQYVHLRAYMRSQTVYNADDF
jgi:hypothetical protein